MTRNDDISWTEKLLDLIRNKDGDSGPPSPDPAGSGDREPGKRRASVSRGKRLSMGGLSMGGTPFSAGVVLGYNTASFALFKGVSRGNPVLVRVRKVPFPTGVTSESDSFGEFLRDALSDFLGPVKRVDIWSSIPSSGVHTSNFKIPFVPGSRVANAVFWTYAKNNEVDEKKEIFDFEVLGTVSEKGIKKTEISAYTAPKAEIEKLKALFSGMGFPLTGISTIAFAFQNLLRTNRLDTSFRNCCVLFIGSDWSRIDLFSRGNIILSRDIRTGLDSFIDILMDSINDEFGSPSDMFLDMDSGLPPDDLTFATGPKEGDVQDSFDPAARSIDRKEARKIFFEYIAGEEGAAPHPLYGEIAPRVIPAVKRLSSQITRSFEYFSANYDSREMERIFITGPLCASPHLIDLIGGETGLAVSPIDPFGPGLLPGGEPSPPASPMERDFFFPSCGMALSGNDHTPNFIFPHTEKALQERIRNSNLIVILLFALLLLIGAGVDYRQGTLIQEKKNRILALEQQRAALGPPIDRNRILGLAGETAGISRSIEESLSRSLPLALLSELSGLTPADIRLIELTARPGVSAGPPEKSRKGTLIMEGVVFKPRVSPESVLADYIVLLSNSPVFSHVSIKEKSHEKMGEKEVLHFTAEMELI